MTQTKEVFVDTTDWANLINPQEDYHTRAATLYNNASRRGVRFVTTNYIIIELVAVLTSPMHVARPTVIAVIEGLKVSSNIKIIHIDQTWDGKAWNLLTRRQGKQWSLVDCSSFIVMEELGITEALTSDHHFEQAGFVRLLKP